MNFIPCLTWVEKGVAKPVPNKFQLSPEELKNIIAETEDLQRKLEKDDASSSGDENGTTYQEEPDKEDDFEKKYFFDSYDNDEIEDEDCTKISYNVSFVDNKDDDYIESDVEYDKEEEEDFIIKQNDNLLLVGHIEEESAVLEIHVYNKEEDAFYIHHDIVLPAYPLALEWLDFNPSGEKPGNYVAVADMTAVIKIWDLDVVEKQEPDYCLGKEVKKSKIEKMKRKYHTDAVISLSWNKNIRNLLASGSADSSIILWDLQEGKPLKKLDHHSDKVQSLQWHPFESSFLLSGSTNGTVTLFDCNIPDAKSWTFSGEIEKVTWNLSNPLKFLCSTDQGIVHSIDMKSNVIEHSYQAHTEAITGLDVCPTHPNVLVTASMDGTIKIWDMEKLTHIQTKKIKVGSIYTIKFAPDRESVLAIGGNDKSHCLKILDLEETLNGDENVSEENEKPKKRNINENEESTLKRKERQNEANSPVKKKPAKQKISLKSELKSSPTSNPSSLKKKPLKNKVKNNIKD